MWRRVLAVVVVGLLISGLFGDALAKKPPRRGKGNPLQWGDPDWPAYSRLKDGNKQVAVKFGFESIPSDGTASRVIERGPVSHDWQKHRWPTRRYELRILGHTIVIRR